MQTLIKEYVKKSCVLQETELSLCEILLRRDPLPEDMRYMR